MPTIRSYQPKDKEDVRAVCIETGPGAAAQAGPARTMLLTSYCDYYIECEPQNCFVVADDDDRAVGYILCAQDCRAYRARFLREYAPRLKGLPFFMRAECRASAFLPKLLAKKYPAHLHIDISEEYQRRGLGSQLMNALTAQLRAKGIPGVLLVVGAGNKKGRNFYGKYGFSKLLRIPTSVVMGLAL